ncbi:MAG: sialate O-acetylesterase [Bacteroidales bacterium]|nr:sialate O-acetylesterase [Bacteroidales bacterium]
MVLQQNTEVAIWGWARANASITIVTSWDNKTHKSEADKLGKWKIKIATIEAGGPYEITLSDGEPIVLKNILLGEVWLCSGQSNMEMPMKGFMGQPVNGSNEIITRSKNPNIRFITIPRSSKTTPQNNFEGQWVEASPKTVADFSATGYFFGEMLNDALDVPIGLINVSYGGSCIQAWMSKNTSRPFEDKPIPGTDDTIKVLNRTPTTLFNGMLNPVIGYGIKGCIWYQGETNYQEADIYPEMLKAMVEEWRQLWKTGEFPFYYVQIAPFNYKQFTPDNWVETYNSAYIREAQLKAMDIIPNSGIAIIMDTGEENCIHPSNKKAAGTRLAYWALSKTYGIEGIGYISPSYNAIEIKDTAIIVSFYNVDRGLTSFGKEITTFEIAGEDRVFYPATVYLRRKSVIVYSPKVKKPVAVRYAFTDFVTGELFSADGLPVSSFRTDNW